MFFSLHIIAIGKVQNVFFRATVFEYAQKNNLVGEVKNLIESNKVEIHIQGEKNEINKFINWLKSNPNSIKIEELKILEKQKIKKLNFSNFKIIY